MSSLADLPHWRFLCKDALTPDIPAWTVLLWKTLQDGVHVPDILQEVSNTFHQMRTHPGPLSALTGEDECDALKLRAWAETRCGRKGESQLVAVIGHDCKSAMR